NRDQGRFPTRPRSAVHRAKCLWQAPAGRIRRFSFPLATFAAGGKTSSPVLKVGAPEQEFVFAVLSLGLSFAVCTTFFVISLHPFTMGQPLSDRYLWMLLVPAMLLLAQLLDGRVARICERLAAILTGNGHRARSWLAQHSIELSIVAIVVLGTFSRLLIEGELVRVRRVGYALPYSYLDV